MNTELTQSLEMLTINQKSFNDGQISSLRHAQVRTAALCAALHHLAKEFDVELVGPMCIDSRGDMTCFVFNDKPGQPPKHYGEKFAALLNTANPRTGLMPGATLTPEASWCYLNHFDVERLVHRYAASL